MNYNVQNTSRGKLKGYPIYIERDRENFNLQKEKTKILAIINKRKIE